jgi:hypothetical protein
MRWFEAGSVMAAVQLFTAVSAFGFHPDPLFNPEHLSRFDNARGGVLAPGAYGQCDGGICFKSTTGKRFPGFNGLASG